MDLLELTCPSCEQVLELDAGFAGGVCRCSHCGTLMTVPSADPSTRRPETKSRPAVPGVPSHAAPTAPGRAADPSTASPQAMTPTTGAVQSDRHTRTVVRDKISQHQPPGQSRAISALISKRTTIYIAVVSIFLLVSGVIVFAVGALYQYQLDKSNKLNQRPDITVEFDYDPDINPYQLDNPNFLGLPLSQMTAMVVDAPATSSHWLGLVKEALMAGTDFDTEAIAIQLIFTHPERQVVFPETPTQLAHLSRNDMRKYLNHNLASGTTDPVNAIRSALTFEPAQLCLVTGQEFSAQHVKAVRRLLRNTPHTRFDVVLIGIHDADLQKLAIDYRGQSIRLTAQQLSAWRYDAY